jgi:hypothetical protein
MISLLEVEKYNFKLRGSREGGVEISSSTYANNFEAWDLELYGPWRYNGDWSIGIDVGSGGGVSGGIIEAGGNGATFAIYELCNMLVIDSHTAGPALSEALAKGCTFIGSRVRGYGSNLRDCVISTVNDGPVNFSYTNCVFSRSSISGTVTNCQFSWTPPTWPAWNAADFSKLALNYSTITSPPSPGVGSPEYIGYPTDLSGNTRDDIGAYASEALPTTPAPTTTTPAPTTTTTTTPAPTTTLAPVTTTPPPDPIVRHHGNGPGQRKIALDEALSIKFGRPWGTMADYPYQP